MPKYKNLDLTKLEDCRWWIQYFQKYVYRKKITYVETALGKLDLDKLSDDDTIFVANEFWRMHETAEGMAQLERGLH